MDEVDLHLEKSIVDYTQDIENIKRGIILKNSW